MNVSQRRRWRRRRQWQRPKIATKHSQRCDEIYALSLYVFISFWYAGIQGSRRNSRPSRIVVITKVQKKRKKPWVPLKQCQTNASHFHCLLITSSAWEHILHAVVASYLVHVHSNTLRPSSQIRADNERSSENFNRSVVSTNGDVVFTKHSTWNAAQPISIAISKPFVTRASLVII